MSPTTLAGIAKKSIGWSIAISVLMILAGILAIALPQIAGLAVTVVVSWLLIFSGVMHLIFAWHARGAGALLLEILLGILYLGVGVYMLRNPALGLESLTLAIAIYLFAEGVLEVVLSLRLRPLPGWGWLMFDAIVTLLLAFLIWRNWPSASMWAIGTLVGISMLFSGITRLMLSLAARRLVSALA